MPRPKVRCARRSRQALDLLDSGQVRVAEKQRRWPVAGQSVAEESGAAVVPAQRHERDQGRPGKSVWWDKVPSKFEGWNAAKFKKAGFRAVPGCDRAPLRLHRAERRADAVLRQSRRLCRFRHHGRHLGDGRLLRADRQELPHLRRRRHRRRARAAAGGPVIIEDNCFIGARSEVVEGVIVREGSVLGMGVYIGASTTIVDRETGEVTRGEVPAYSVVAPRHLAGQVRPIPARPGRTSIAP